MLTGPKSLGCYGVVLREPLLELSLGEELEFELPEVELELG